MTLNKKIRIYFNEFNIPTDNTVYFPFSSGLLQAFAQTFQEIKDNFEFLPFLFRRESVDKVLEKYDNPDIACFSSSIWNHQLNLAVAKAVKKKFPQCLIIFGGPNVPSDDSIFKQYPFIDIGIFGEGEIMFKDVLFEYLKNGTTLLKNHTIRRNLITTKELDIFPSPYSSGLFNQLIVDNPDIEFKAIIETNRSCPFSCDFCFWGQSVLNKKIAYHSIDYTQKEADWIAQNKIKYVFCADANFGMYKRDIDIATLLADIKNKYSYPEKFRVCYGKNVTETIFQTAQILSQANLAKTVTLAKQSNDKVALSNIHRSNISSKTFKELQIKYTNAGIPTYTELILGLPGETYSSFLAGLEEVFESVINNQVFIYHCQILPNTEMAKPEYLNKHGIITKKIPLAEVHGSIRDNSIEQEFEEVIIGSASMNNEDWKRCAVISWVAQSFYGLKATDEIIDYLRKAHNVRFTDYFEFVSQSNIEDIKYLWNIANDITNGQRRCQHDPKFGTIYYDPEEFLFLNVCSNKNAFFSQLYRITVEFLKSKDIQINEKELEEVFQSQKENLPSPENYSSSQEFATKVILHGRKSNATKKPRNPIGFQLI